jgi:hypothetical protein
VLEVSVFCWVAFLWMRCRIKITSPTLAGLRRVLWYEGSFRAEEMRRNGERRTIPLENAPNLARQVELYPPVLSTSLQYLFETPTGIPS